ncbi:MAG TPA: MSMEG_4193 family putative phosphomutase [Acidimicrobiia bacterium]
MSDQAHKSPTRLVLVRHAVTAHTGGKLSGRMPGIDLTDQGRAQAAAVAERLATAPISTVYASPIERTMQTAQAIAARHELTVQPLDGVIEAEYGDWTDKTLGELAKTDEWKVVQRTPSRAKFPNGESLLEMQTRMVIALDEVAERHKHETIVVVSHADPIKAAVAHYTGMHLDLFQRVNISPASATVFELHAHGVMMLTCNETGGLGEMLAPPPPPAEGTEQPAGSDADTSAAAAEAAHA